MKKVEPKTTPVELTDDALNEVAGGLRSSIQKKKSDTENAIISKFG